MADALYVISRLVWLKLTPRRKEVQVEALVRDDCRIRDDAHD